MLLMISIAIRQVLAQPPQALEHLWLRQQVHVFYQMFKITVVQAQHLLHLLLAVAVRNFQRRPFLHQEQSPLTSLHQ